MNYSDDELLPLSALQHLLFCERQCALIHLELAWEENRLTAEGRVLHERAHEADDETRGNVRIVRGLRLRSLRLGLIGQADVVEFHRTEQGWHPYPVEYKRGKPKQDDSDKVQLCAQAICLEEMLNASIPGGALFYGTTRRRLEVGFKPALRELTASTAARLHRLVGNGLTPPARYENKCGACSLLALCLPQLAAQHEPVRDYLSRTIISLSMEGHSPS